VLKRAWLSVGIFGVVLGAVACAQVLGYEDYRARDDSAPAMIDSGAPLDTEVFVTDTADVGEPPVRPPQRPKGDAVASGSGKTLWLAFKRYELGSIDPTGVSDETAWTAHGYDLDAICTSRAASVANVATCRRPEGAQQDSLLDGERCRDNNFGRHVGTILRAAAPDTEKTLNEQIALGSSTWLLRIDDVDMSADDPYAPATLYRVADERMSDPRVVNWDGTDVRSVHADSVIDGDIARGVTTMPRGYIANGTWVSGDPSRLNLSVPVTASLFVAMKMDNALITLELSGDRTTGTNGIIAGALALADVEVALKAIADNAGVCPGTPLYVTLLSSMAKMPDVSMGAPGLQDTTKTCDGVSVGIGFAVVPVQPATNVVPPPPPRKPKCADAG